MVDRWMREVRERGFAPTGVDAAPAATVVLLRDGDEGLEVLLTRRSSKLAFHGGAWVFPGGRVDADDYAADPDDVWGAARRAAVREAAEEAGMVVDEASLVYHSHWTTPEISPKRFATWFFVAPAGSGTAVADGSEATALHWFRPAEALAAREAGEIELAPPQHVTLLGLAPFARVADALDAVATWEPMEVTPHFALLDDGTAVCIYDDDVAYGDEALDLDRPGRRHRLVMGADKRWVYERD